MQALRRLSFSRSLQGPAPSRDSHHYLSFLRRADEAPLQNRKRTRAKPEIQQSASMSQRIRTELVSKRGEFHRPSYINFEQSRDEAIGRMPQKAVLMQFRPILHHPVELSSHPIRSLIHSYRSKAGPGLYTALCDLSCRQSARSRDQVSLLPVPRPALLRPSS